MAQTTGNVNPFINFDPHRQARTLFWCGYPVSQIAEVLDIPRSTVQSWKDRGRWDEATPLQKVEGALENRLALLIAKEEKTGSDFKEIDLLMRQMTQAARIGRYNGGGNEADLNEKVANRNKGEKKKPRQNLIGPEDQAKLIAAFDEGLFDYQLKWKNSTAFSTRAILKSRQIGATYYFAREAVIRAIETGNNQIFISASRAQANIFKRYIVDFVYRETGIKLTGDPIIIDRGDDAEGKPLPPVDLVFLGTNYKTAQGYHGDVYIDEFFWIHGFEDIDTVASAMASQKFYRVTYFSTPSTIHHSAYALWSGNQFNQDRPKADRVRIDIDHASLRDGKLGGDGMWRHVVTIEDALIGGCNLFDLDKLKLKYSIEQFERLFMCEFVDDSRSAFPLSLVRACLVDSWEVWKDFEPMAIKPYAGECWLGYDPSQSENGDQAALVVVAAPKDAKAKFRVMEKLQFLGKDFQEQAAEIKRLKSKYHITEIAIDTTGMGAAVYQLVKEFHPTVRRIDYSPVVKSLMVLKAQNVMRNRRLEMDQGTHMDIVAALGSIHPEQTKGGKMITYVARRSEETGHGDLAWALLHALYCEPLENTTGENIRKSRVARTRDDKLENQGHGEGRRARRRRALSGQGARLHLRRGGIRTGRREVAQLPRNLAQRSILRAAGRAAQPVAVPQCHAASPVRHCA